MVIADEICDNALDSMLDSENDKLALKLSSYIQSNFLQILYKSYVDIFSLHNSK